MATHRSQAHFRGWGGASLPHVSTRAGEESQGLFQTERFVSSIVGAVGNKLWQMTISRASSKAEGSRSLGK